MVKIEDPAIYTHKYSQLTFNKNASAIQGVIMIIFNKGCWRKWKSICKNFYLNTDLYFTQIQDGSQT